MYTLPNKKQEDSSQWVESKLSQKQNGSVSDFSFADNRLEAITQRRLQEIVDSSTQTRQIAQLQSMADNYTVQQQPMLRTPEMLALSSGESEPRMSGSLKSDIENLSQSGNNHVIQRIQHLWMLPLTGDTEFDREIELVRYEREAKSAEFGSEHKRPQKKEGLMELGDRVIREIKGKTPEGPANQEIPYGYDLEQEQEDLRRIASQVLYSKTTDFYGKLSRYFGNVGPEDTIMENWQEYFMSLGYETYEEPWGAYSTFNRSSPLFVHFLTAYAVETIGGAVCAQYAPYVALKLAEERPELEIAIMSGGGHSYAVAQDPSEGVDIVVDPWPYGKSQKAHRLDELKEQFSHSEKPIMINMYKQRANKDVPTLSQFIKFMKLNESRIFEEAGIDTQALDEQSKPAVIDWDVETSYQAQDS